MKVFRTEAAREMKEVGDSMNSHEYKMALYAGASKIVVRHTGHRRLRRRALDQFDWVVRRGKIKNEGVVALVGSWYYGWPSSSVASKNGERALLVVEDSLDARGKTVNKNLSTQFRKREEIYT